MSSMRMRRLVQVKEKGRERVQEQEQELEQGTQSECDGAEGRGSGVQALCC